MMCVLSTGRGRAEIWQGLLARRTYGVSRSRMVIDHTLNGAPMGAEISPGPAQFTLSLTAANAVDRVEFLKDNILEKMIVHSGTWERQPLPGRFAFKFEVEFGWGPETRLFPDAALKVWEGSLQVPGHLMGVEKLRGKPLPPEKEGVMNLVGLGFFFLLFIFLTFRDVGRIIGG